jgi:putative tricarboxylic transport membrane protein
MLFIILLGTLYGFIFGLIPVAGATTALITVFSFYQYFQYEPYLLVAFTTSIVVSSSIGDSFSSIMLNIPGAGGSAATMIDGFPMAQRNEGARALGAAICVSTVNGLLWGIIVFLFLPHYTGFVLNFGIPEMFVFLILAFFSVIFINNQHYFRGFLALIIGIFLGMIGQNPITGDERFTLDIQYLGDGIQLVPIMAGILAFPELIHAYLNDKNKSSDIFDIKKQMVQGFKDSWIYKWDGLRGGFIGAVIGAIPGIGGNVADWLAYGQTIALNKKETFGNGNVRGVVGCEGANNAQKATSYIPTILFGIPGAPFEIIIISLFMLVGLELGSPDLLLDITFFNYMTESYILSLILTFFIAVIFVRYAVNIVKIPFKYFFWFIMLLLIWVSIQYTKGIEDYLIFGFFCIFGLILKRFHFNRAALILGFILAERLESLYIQFNALYSYDILLQRPISLGILSLTFILVGIGLTTKTRIKYS